MSDEMICYMDIKEFRENGYLQEANRLFFHPLGLALEVIQREDGTEALGGVWDYRGDDEGMLYGGCILDPLKAERVERERRAKIETRRYAGCGPDGVQPIETNQQQENNE